MSNGKTDMQKFIDKFRNESGEVVMPKVQPISTVPKIDFSQRYETMSKVKSQPIRLIFPTLMEIDETIEMVAKLSDEDRATLERAERQALDREFLYND